MVDTVIRLSSVLSYNPPLVSYWMAIGKLSPVLQLLLDARLRIPSVLTLTSRRGQTRCSWRLQLSGACLYWRYGELGSKGKEMGKHFVFWAEKEPFGQRCQFGGERRGGQGGAGLRATF